MKKQKLLESIELAKKLINEQKEKVEDSKASENEQSQVFNLFLSRFLRLSKRLGKMPEERRLMGSGRLLIQLMVIFSLYRLKKVL